MKYFLTISFFVSIVLTYLNLYYINDKLLKDINDKNYLLLHKDFLLDKYFLCNGFYLNTSFFNKQDCHKIKIEMSKINEKLDNDFMILDFYILIKGKKDNYAN